MEFVTAGESHGPALTAVVSGVPAQVSIDEAALNADMARRQRGYGRGGRMKIETDRAQVLSGVRFGKTLGTPITLQVVNADHANWRGRMDVFGRPAPDLARETHPRPGHADLVGMLKIATNDARDILERSSARETAARVAAGGIAKALLSQLGVSVHSVVKSVGAVRCSDDALAPLLEYRQTARMSKEVQALLDAAEASELRCPDADATERMKEAIDNARLAGESLGGQVVVVAYGLVPGLGSYACGPQRLTSRLGGACFSIPAVKGVEFGLGFEAARRTGSQVHDGIVFDRGSGHFGRTGNNAGGLEGGMTTGAPLAITLAMKPIPTMMNPLATVDTDTLEPAWASKERSDVCAVPACGVVAEAQVAMVLADAYTEMFGNTCVADLLAARDAFLERITRS